MSAEGTAVVSLNLDAPFESQAARAAAAGDKLINTLDGIAAASQRATAQDLGIKTNTPAFSTATDTDFKRSRWETPPTSPKTPGGDPVEQAKKAAAAKASAEKNAGSNGAPKDLKYLLKQAGIGKAALGALGVASALELSKLALGYRGMAHLQAITARAGMQVRQLFRGVDPMPVIRAADRFFQIFSQNTPAGKALSQILTTAFTGVFGAVEKAEPYVSGFFKGMIIGALKVEESWYDLQTAILPITDALAGIDTGGLDGVALAADAGAIAFRALAVTIETTAAGLRAVVDAYNALDARVRRGSMSEEEQIRLGNADRQRAEGKARDEANSGKSRQEVFTSVNGAKPVMTEMRPAEDDASAKGVATGMTYGKGLEKGMAAAGDAVEQAGVDLGARGDKGVRTGADAHSPSRKTTKTGKDMGAGVIVGMGATASDVQAAAERDLVPTLPSGARGGGGGSAAGASRVTIEVKHVWPAGVDTAKRSQIEDAANAGTSLALRAYASQLGVSLELAP